MYTTCLLQKSGLHSILDAAVLLLTGSNILRLFMECCNKTRSTCVQRLQPSPVWTETLVQTYTTIVRSLQTATDLQGALGIHIAQNISHYFVSPFEGRIFKNTSTTLLAVLKFSWSFKILFIYLFMNSKGCFICCTGYTTLCSEPATCGGQSHSYLVFMTTVTWDFTKSLYTVNLCVLLLHLLSGRNTHFFSTKKKKKIMLETNLRFSCLT